MRRRRYPGGPLEDRQIPVQSELAAWWATFMFLYVYVDILGLYMPGVVEDILAGVVWELEISQTWALVALTLMAVPILMVALSVTLPARASRWANLVVAPLYVVVSVANGIGESWTYYFAMAIGLEVLVLVMIARSAWTWPRAERSTAVPYEGDRMQRA